jgi:multidrug efflux pump subunit AcrA (membrane-fusion protein)
LRSPADGIVFDLQAKAPGFVANSSQPVVKIVPDEALTAKVFITNKDIGFVKKGMKVNVRIDSYPFTEFGELKGELVWIGSDALPPEQVRPYDSFPAKIRLDRQSLVVNNQELPVQSGMSVTVNIKVRDRTVMSIFSDLFTKQIDSLKTAR